MKKKIFLVLVTALAFSACNNPPKHKIIAKLVVDNKSPLAFYCLPVKAVLIDEQTGAPASFDEDKDVDVQSDDGAVVRGNPCAEVEIVPFITVPAKKSEVTFFITAIKPGTFNIKAKVGSFSFNKKADFQMALKFEDKIKKIEILDGDRMKVIEGNESTNTVKVKVTNEDGSLAEGVIVVFSSNQDETFSGYGLPYHSSPTINGVAESYFWAPPTDHKPFKVFKIIARVDRNPDLKVVFGMASISLNK
jgi:hypothetical protein